MIETTTSDQSRSATPTTPPSPPTPASAPAATQPAGSPAPPSPVRDVGVAPRRRHRGIGPAAGAWWAAALIAAVLGVLALFSPYSRGILGEQDGARRLVETRCAAPVIAVSDNGSRELDASGQWRSDAPPCQRSAGFRIGLGALLLAGAVGLGNQGRRASNAARDDAPSE